MFTVKNEYFTVQTRDKKTKMGSLLYSRRIPKNGLFTHHFSHTHILSGLTERESESLTIGMKTGNADIEDFILQPYII